MASPIITPQLWAQVRQAQGAAALPAPTPPASLLPAANGGASALTAVPSFSAPTLPNAIHSQALDPQSVRDVQTRNDLLAHGDGISNIQNPWLRGFARVADVVGSVVAPGIEHAIPGTMGNHQHQLAIANANIAQDSAQQLQSAQIQQEQAKAAQEQARAEAYSDPQKAVDPSKTVQTDDGVYQLDPATGKYDVRVGDRVEKAKPIEEQAYEYALSQGKSPLEAYQAIYSAKNQKDAPLAQQYLEALASGNTTQAALISRTIHDTQVQPKIDVHTATERPESEGTWTPGLDANKNPVMFNSKTGEVKPMAPGGFTKGPTAGQSAKIDSDEQKRTDLAQNLDENIDKMEDILTRRPELFGPVAGRLTQTKAAFGSSDPDVAALMTIEHQLGMVAQGAHGMRSAQGVEAAANSLTNGFKNSPEATRAALETARQSVKTFQEDAQNPGKARQGANATVSPDSGTGKADYVFVPGKGLVKQ